MVLEAVKACLAAKTKSQWPPEMLAWMQSPPDIKDTADKPDFKAIRQEANERWEISTACYLKDFGA